MRCWPFILFELPTIYQSLPVGILWGRCGERIALISGWLAYPRRGNLRPNRADDGYAYGSRDADQNMPSFIRPRIDCSPQSTADRAHEKPHPVCGPERLSAALR